MIHQLADVQSLNIGEGTKIWQFCIILKNAVIGKNCNINCQVFIENDVVIGDNVTIKPGVQIWDGLRIGDNVFIGPNVTFTNDLIPRSKMHPDAFEITTIEFGASIGANATIIAGVKIGANALIGAGAVITKNILPYSVWYGTPAIQKGYITERNIILDLELKDKQGNQYHLLNGIPTINDQILKFKSHQ